MGLFDHMVVQRDAKNRSAALFSGECTDSGSVRVSVTLNGEPVRGFSGKVVGQAARGKMNGSIDGLPVGGPYELTLSVGDQSAVVKDLLVGDVWLLGGQSNMQGCGLFPKKRPVADKEVRAFYMDDRWGVAKDPIHNMWQCVDQVHIDLQGGVRSAKPAPDWGVCPGPSFGAEMRKLTKGVPQGLIACAHGGTSMPQWDPKLKKAGGKSLYGAMVRRLQKNGGRVAGMIWYQGCSDCFDGAAQLYTERMKEFVSALRRDCQNKELPIVIVQIARVISWAEEQKHFWNMVQEQQRLLAYRIKNLQTVPVIDLPLDDTIHISGESQAVLGGRMAQAMEVLRGNRQAGLPPITLESTEIEETRCLGVVVAKFGNVMGGLQAGSRPSGFAITSDVSTDNIFDTVIDGDTVRIRTTMAPADLSMAMLHYGFGYNPYCNITDKAGRSLPVFGPIALGKPRAITSFIRSWEFSDFKPSAGDLTSLKYPAEIVKSSLEKRTFSENFCLLHPEIVARGNKDEVIYFVTTFNCASEMRLNLVLGYDGPVKAWVNGRKVFHDPSGTNPATPQKGVGAFKAKAGDHELVVALGTNSGNAWGIYVRLERLGVSAKALRDVTYELPSI